jgi:hypothetical protein
MIKSFSEKRVMQKILKNPSVQSNKASVSKNNIPVRSNMALQFMIRLLRDQARLRKFVRRLLSGKTRLCKFFI